MSDEDSTKEVLAKEQGGIIVLVESKINDYVKRGRLLTGITVFFVVIVIWQATGFLLSANNVTLSEFFKETYKASLTLLSLAAGGVFQGFYFGIHTKIKAFKLAISLIPFYPHVGELEKKLVDKVIETLLGEIK